MRAALEAYQREPRVFLYFGLVYIPAAIIAAVLGALDAGYAHSNEEGLRLVSGRNRKVYAANRDVPLEAARRTERATDLIYLVERTPGRLEIDH